MTQIPEQDYLFIHYGFGGEDIAPSLTLQPADADDFIHFAPTGEQCTFAFDTTQRHCTGWHDLATSQSYACPDATTLPAQFDHCRHCQNKTGFNPAFYNASSVSPQQQARNAQPHFLYLAHFAPGVVKVGISWAERGLRRLLDQGARSCLIIKTYPTATVARQYEAKTAALPGIAETLQAKKKHALLVQTYDAAQGAEELIAVRDRLRRDVGITPDDSTPVALDSFYMQKPLEQPIILDTEHKISGRCIGMIGNLLVVEQNGQQYGLPLGALTGYRVSIHPREEANTHQPQQASLF